MLPVVKWAGGKRQLLPELRQRMPIEFNTYVEPFLGSGALFLDILPNNAILNDSNSKLINMYVSIRDHEGELSEYLDLYQTEYNDLGSMLAKENYYYQKRIEFNNHILNAVLGTIDAALFIFLNKSCYNGLYRENATGLYNTPFGKRAKVHLYDTDNLAGCSAALQNVLILNGDFEEACQDLQPGDFVFFDSPYYDTFDTYQGGGFPEEEHLRLANLFAALSRAGVNCMLSNSNTDFIRNIYQDYRIEEVRVKRMINCEGNNREGTELIIRNY